MHYASADDPAAKNHIWLQQQWQIARQNLNHAPSALLILDEIQKTTDWSTTVKQLWDEDSFAKRPLKVMLLGSAPLLIQHGLSESLAGRFEIIPIIFFIFSSSFIIFPSTFATTRSNFSVLTCSERCNFKSNAFCMTRGIFCDFGLFKNVLGTEGA